ncbi:hypothetical protein BDFG_05264 [Blastomyces dermatitidis ATCC 26199]|nr:hypothetical protein BDFG_05264 [Blastomyces dermatitidis ATCC 26199]
MDGAGAGAGCGGGDGDDDDAAAAAAAAAASPLRLCGDSTRANPFHRASTPLPPLFHRAKE